ncbi:hypothetical protein BB560_007147, partial [Smittium megazygosporum]
SLLAQSRDRYSPYMKELETGRFMNGIRVVRTLILDRIKCSPTPLNQCPVDRDITNKLSFKKKKRNGTAKALQHRYTVNDKTKISAWIKAHNMRNTGSWMDLQMCHPDNKLGLQDI